MQLYLIRHGQSYVNLKEWDRGNTDEGLTERGQAQAQAMAAWLPTQLPSIDVLYASTMRRTLETAAPLSEAYGLEIITDDRLREIGNNRNDGTPWPNDDLPKEYADFWSSEQPFASVTPERVGGESMLHFRTRVGAFLEDIVPRHRDEVLVAVLHGGVMEMVIDHVFNIGAWRRCEVLTRNTGITHLEYVAHPNREIWRMHFHNRVDHLNGKGPDANLTPPGTLIKKG